MEKGTIYQNALKRLKYVYENLKEKHTDCLDIVESKDVVLARYQPIFLPNNISNMSEEEFLSFLKFENNKHWSSLHRHGKAMTSDMPRLREALGILVDESGLVDERYDEATSMVKGLGRAVSTAILTVTYPGKYGVWNYISQTGLETVELWYEIEDGRTEGGTYANINGALVELAEDLGMDLWTLDTLWWALINEPDDEEGIIEYVSEQRFGLEQHLHDFLVDNWDNTQLAEDWVIYPGDEEGIDGSKFPTAIGQIDILAKHKKEPVWLVIELKRHQSSDVTVGQIQRYMGWVQEHLAGTEGTVKGLIIAHEMDEKLKYALKAAKGIEVMLYEVEFRLREPG
jgi:hypothetical protein